MQRAQRDFAARVLRGGTAHENLAILSSASALKCGGIGGPPDHYTDVPAGEVTLRAISDLYLYPNDLVALKVTGAMLRDWLERAASVFNRLDPSRPDQPVIDPSTPPCYLYETVLGGLDYQIDLSEPALFTPPRGGVRINAPTGQGGRVRNIRHKDRSLSDDTEFLLVTNGFRASGGGGGIRSRQRPSRFWARVTASAISCVTMSARSLWPTRLRNHTGRCRPPPRGGPQRRSTVAHAHFA